MAFRFKRRGKNDRRLGVKQKDVAAIEQALDEARALYNGGPDFDLRRPVHGKDYVRHVLVEFQQGSQKVIDFVPAHSDFS